MLRLKDGFYAKDEDGAIFMYNDLPVQEPSEWVGPICEQVDNIIIDEDWQDSLYEIKDGIITKVITFIITLNEFNKLCKEINKCLLS